MAGFIDKLLKRKVEPAATADSSAPEQEEDGFRLAVNQRLFDRYNADKTAFLLEQLTPRKKLTFHLIPLLLHLPAGDVLECKDACANAPHGLYGFQLTPECLDAFAQAFPAAESPQVHPIAVYDAKLPIRIVSLMGSLGSIAQNNKSDFDYWLGVETDQITARGWSALQEKLKGVENWARAFCGADIHFFPMDLRRVRKNDFGAAAGESSGTAQAKLLKEEFYRTMILVAGQTPLWWIMPAGVNDAEYGRLAAVADAAGRVDETRLVDLGNVHNISLSEFYGAAIWQINKTMASPFKSILKLALLEEYMASHGRTGLLSTELKQRLHNNEQDLGRLDPYLMMYERVAAHLQARGREGDLDLLRRSFYIKSQAGLTLADHRNPNPTRKKQIILKLIQDWGFNHREIEKLNRPEAWSFRETQQFSKRIKDFVVATYKNVADQLKDQQDQVDLAISQRDLSVLGRKLYVYYAKRTNKIDSIHNVIDNAPPLNGVTFQPRLDKNDRKIWGGYRGLLSWEVLYQGGGASSLLREAPHLAEILLWLVYNRLYDTDTSINLNLGQAKLGSYVTAPDLQRLLKELMRFFQRQNNDGVKEDAYLRQPHTERMFLTVNLEEADKTRKLKQASLMTQNSWGEIFFKGYDGVEVETCFKMGRSFLRKHFAHNPLGVMENFRVFLPDRDFKRVIAPQLNKYFGLKVAT